jgi:hypothetical protein
LAFPGQVLLEHDVEVGVGGGGGDRVAAEGETVEEAGTLVEGIGDLLLGHDGAEGGVGGGDALGVVIMSG